MQNVLFFCNTVFLNSNKVILALTLIDLMLLKASNKYLMHIRKRPYFPVMINACLQDQSLLSILNAAGLLEKQQ